MRRAYRRALVVSSLAIGALMHAPESPAQSGHLRLDPVTVDRNARSFRAVGEDSAAPRALVLWRFEAGVFRRVADARSNVQGRFDFGEQTLQLSKGSFHVAPAGEVPDHAHSLVVERSLPSPMILSPGLDPREIELAPAIFDGAIEVRDTETGRLLLRHPIVLESRGRSRIDFVAEGIAGRTPRVTLEHVLPDGRRSPPIVWSLSAPD